MLTISTLMREEKEEWGWKKGRKGDEVLIKGFILITAKRELLGNVLSEHNFISIPEIPDKCYP